MEIIVKQLIFHPYNEEYLINNCSPNALKQEYFEWDEDDNKNHPYADDIENNDIVISIRDIFTLEDYGFFFFKVEHNNEINLFHITKAVLDNNLPKHFFDKAIHDILTTLVNGVYHDGDRLFINNDTSYPFYEPHVEQTKEKVASFIIKLYITIKAPPVSIQNKSILFFYDCFNLSLVFISLLISSSFSSFIIII